MCIYCLVLSVTVNGQQHGFIKPQRGLRQGDPLSSYLFLICAKGLSNLLKLRERQGWFSGVTISRGGPIISHLLFANDSLIFYKAVKEESEIVKDVLELYGKASGQLVNIHKSSILFSSNTHATRRMQCQEILGFSKSTKEGKYLGLPFIIGRSKRATLTYIKDRISKKKYKVGMGAVLILLGKRCWPSQFC